MMIMSGVLIVEFGVKIVMRMAMLTTKMLLMRTKGDGLRAEVYFASDVYTDKYERSVQRLF